MCRVPTPHLDGKHVVFGRVRSNRGLVRRIENIPTTSDRPNEEVKIEAAGVLSPEEVEAEEKARQEALASGGVEDVYEVGHLLVFERLDEADLQDYPADEEKIDAEKAEEALQVAQKLREVGTK